MQICIVMHFYLFKFSGKALTVISFGQMYKLHKRADILHIFNLDVVFSKPIKEKVSICHGKIYK